MRYLPKSPAERQELLAAIGVQSVEELFSSIPEAYRLKRPLNLPGPYSEQEVIDYFQSRAAETCAGHTSFLGAGVYNHLRSVVTDSITRRAAVLTSGGHHPAEVRLRPAPSPLDLLAPMCRVRAPETG